MQALHPVSSPILWLRVLAAAAVIVVVPGYLLAGRHAAGGRLTRFVCSVSMGWLGTTLVARVLHLAGLPVHPWTVTPAVALLGLGLGRWSTWRSAWSRVFANLRPESPRESGALAAVAVAWLVMLVIAYGHFVVPPTVDDAGNHVFLVGRIAETASLDAVQVFAAPLGSLRVGYLVGWHVTAALVAGAAGVAPYVGTWLLVLAMLASLPLALSLLWRAFRVPAPLVILGAVWLLTDAFMPSGILGWGGFGQLIGMALVPVTTLLVAAAARERSLLTAVVAGAVLGAMIHVHASEVVVSLGLGIWLATGNGGRDPGDVGGARSLWVVAGVGLLALAVAAGPEVWSLALSYQATVVPGAVAPAERFGAGLRRLLGAAGGPDLRHAAVVLGVGLGLAQGERRKLAVAALVLGVFYLTLAVLQDPVSRALASPFYAQSPRILYLQIYVLPPLLGLPLMALCGPAVRGRWRRPAAILAVLLAVAWFVPGLLKNVRDLRSQRAPIPFVAADYDHALGLTAVVQPGQVVANGSRDGGAWALQVSGVAGVLPHGWERFQPDGGKVSDLVRDLATVPWSAAALTLRDAGVVYLYVSDTVSPGAENSVLRRTDIDADARFEPVLVGPTATLYRIRWNGP